MEHFDVLIVGAGISGIGAAVYLAERCPDRRFAILEAREELGGTWDLFRYPGVRSDSDMYTLGFSFRPWTDARAIADGASIRQYLKDTAREYGLYSALRFGHAVRRASWSSRAARWTVSVELAATGEVQRLSCEFLYMCTGYYDYAKGHAPEFAGSERFRGRVVHPQHWTPDVEYAGKRVVVIGSGATAITLVPALAEAAAHVTLLQRSPSYVLALPLDDPFLDTLRRLWSVSFAARVARWRNILINLAIFQFCRRLPGLARKLLLDGARSRLGEQCAVEPHFSPRYAPWDQRLCLAPDGDVFEAIRRGRASVVTDTIEAFTESGLALASGAQLPADLVVTATGLELQLLGNVELSVDGAAVDAAQSISYRGLMFSGIPNLALSFGYANASWTLRSELTAAYLCRLLQYMKRHGYRQCRPKLSARSGPPQPFVDLASGYVKRAAERLPRQGSRAPWRVYQNYLLDWLSFRYAGFSDGSLEFSSGAAEQASPAAARGDQPA